MVTPTLLIRLVVIAFLVATWQLPGLGLVDLSKRSTDQSPGLQWARDEAISGYGKLPACNPIKGKPAVRAKSPDVLGAEPSTKTLTCFSKTDVAAGKAILSGNSLACFACHGPNAAWNPSVMLSNLRAQGDGTLSLANISSVNSAHLFEMSGSVATSKQLKQIRAYLKCSFKG